MLFCALLSLLLLSIKPSSLDTLRAHWCFREKLSLKSSIRRTIPVSALLLPHLSVWSSTLPCKSCWQCILLSTPLTPAHTYLPSHMQHTMKSWWMMHYHDDTSTTYILNFTVSLPYIGQNLMQDRWAMMHAIVGHLGTASWHVRRSWAGSMSWTSQRSKYVRYLGTCTFCGVQDQFLGCGCGRSWEEKHYF